MNPKSIERLLVDLKERAKELNCLYQVEEIMSEPELPLVELFQRIVNTVPAGWQYPDICGARISYGDLEVQGSSFRETNWSQHSDIVVQDGTAGRLTVSYLDERPAADEGPFLKEERKLINAIADRLKHRILHHNLKAVFEGQGRRNDTQQEWAVIIDLLRRTDSRLLTRIAKKMLNHLAWTGCEEAQQILQRISPEPLLNGEENHDENRPSRVSKIQDLLSVSEDVFRIAAGRFSEHQTLALIQKWIKEDRSGFLIRTLENPNSSLAEIAAAIDRFRHLAPHGAELSKARERALQVSLIQRLLDDDPQFVETARRAITLNDFSDIFDRTIHPAGSHGRLGGKGAGLVIAAEILRKNSDSEPILRGIKIPKTWHITSDGLPSFINFNDLEEIVEHKYKDIDQVRQEYPYIIQVFKNASFPPEIIRGLSIALDDFGDTPLVVRSSSLLEDGRGTSFAGKYKSLFIANQGSKRQRLAALTDAIAEVYASTFGPDPIGYRSERGLIDLHEEMGILIQEVVGTRIGRYFMPAFAGVGFSTNEFLWSKRIRREDGLLRLVPGLGTRAVDRLADDYPILVSPGQPSLRVNVTVEEKVRYSPRRLDAINLETGSFETVEIRGLFQEFGDEYPMLHQLVSVLQDDTLVQPWNRGFNKKRDRLIVTFDGVLAGAGFVEQISKALRTLQSEYRGPMDIEFAHDGSDLYLLQCRPQSRGPLFRAAPLPRDTPKERMLFSAHRFVSNGIVHGITHIVYVDPQQYSLLKDRAELLAVGAVVAKLNRLLPRRRFILVGPGRWGSRGDIRLGVSVAYSDINNSAMLVEIAQKHRDYVPEVSFGTHFFQDLVESSIRYLPLYPDDSGTDFNRSFFTESPSSLTELAPEAAHLSAVVRVIDVALAAPGMVAEVLMNGELDEAVAILTPAATVHSDTPVVE